MMKITFGTGEESMLAVRKPVAVLFYIFFSFHQLFAALNSDKDLKTKGIELVFIKKIASATEEKSVPASIRELVLVFLYIFFSIHL